MLRALTLYPWLNTAEDEKRRDAVRWVLTHWKEYQDECARRREALPSRTRPAGHARLNENYKKLISKLPTERKNALVEAQRAWIKFRDANCGFYADPVGGSAARMIANECFLKATADRAKELRLLADDLP